MCLGEATLPIPTDQAEKFAASLLHALGLVETGETLVLALPSGVIGSVAADLIGGVIATMAWNTALGRQTMSRTLSRPVSLVIDELPRFRARQRYQPDRHSGPRPRNP